MTDTAVAPVDTTAPAPASVTSLSGLSDSQRDTWLKTGELPHAAPAEPVTPAPTEPTAEPTPEPVKVDTTPAKEPKPRTDVNARLGQMAEQKRLATERADKLEQELAALKAGRVAASEPITTEPAHDPADTKTPSYLDLVKRYQSDPAWPTYDAAAAAGFDDPYGATLAAQAAFVQQRQLAERDQATAQTAAQTRVQARVEKAFTEARAMAGFNEDAVNSFDAPPHMAEAIFESDFSGQLLHYFSEHPDEGRAIAATEPLAAARAIGRLEAKFESQSSPVVSSTPATQKTVSSAPPPAVTLGAKHTNGAVDDVEAAIQAGDTSRYIEAANKREVAAMRSGRR